MLAGLSLGQIINYLHEKWQKLPDKRDTSNNNTKYKIEEAALSAFAVFWMQSPSFLAHQRDMQRRKGKSNAKSLFKIGGIPSDPQIRNILDQVEASHIDGAYYAMLGGLRKGGYMEVFEGYGKTELVSLDGFTFQSSKKVSCGKCTVRRDRNGDAHYYHSAVTPVIVHPEQPYVLPLPLEFIVPQDGHEKQDSEQAAIKRWFSKHSKGVKRRTRTYLADDLHSRQPTCQLIDEKYEQYFIFVCKPDSHKTLYKRVALREQAGTLGKHQSRKWNGRHGECWSYRFGSDLPLREGQDAMRVNWAELTIMHQQTGEILYRNSWITNHTVNAACVAGVAEAGRCRWKGENENNNVLTNRGYHAKHNFGHGKQHLANTLLALNILAFLIHTVLDITHQLYRKLRVELGRRDTFFHDLRALTRYFLFNSWDVLWQLMADGLALTH